MSTASSDSKEAKSGKRKAEHFIKRKSFLRELWIYIWQSLVDLWQWGTWGDAYRFQARLQMLMEFTDDLMKKHGMGREYWVDYGCLLGAVRHQRLILWDHDLDIGVTTKCYNKMMELMRAKEPLPEGYEWYYNEESQYLQIWQGGDIWVDIVQYGYNAEKRELQPILKDYYTKDPENREEYCPPIQEEFVLPLGTGRLWKREYPIPADPDSCAFWSVP